jgi:hypothetical protein
MSRCLLLTDGCDSIQRVVAEDKSPFLHESRSWHCEIVNWRLPHEGLVASGCATAERRPHVESVAAIFSNSSQRSVSRRKDHFPSTRIAATRVRCQIEQQKTTCGTVVNQLIRKAMKNMPA